jgi:PA domain/Secretion system C-terminal sorting domain
MRIFTLFLISLFASLSLNAQVFLINSPEDVAGSYIIGTAAAGFGPLLTDSIWCGDLSLTDPTNGCTAITTNLTGKIAVIDRGTCEFGVKVLGAETAGAVAAVIVNNQMGAGVIQMGAGAVGAQVTIPSVFISFEDGLILKAAINAGTVNACMGNIILPNDVKTGIDAVTSPFEGAKPAHQITAAGSAVFTPAARINNIGVNTGTNVTTEATITFTPDGGTASVEYNETTATGDLIVGDTVDHLLPDFEYSGSPVGVYDVFYEISIDSVDGQPSNNDVDYQFTVTENAFAEGPWDFTNNRPRSNASFTISGGGNFESLSSFRVLNGVGFQIDSVEFFTSIAAASAPNLAGVEVQATLYEWFDTNADGGVTADEVVVVGFSNPYQFPAEATAAEWVTVPILENVNLENGYVVPDDGLVYFIGTRYIGAFTVFFGFNTAYSWGLANQLGLMTSDADFGYLQTSTILNDNQADFSTVGLFTDFFSVTSTGLYINPVPVSTNNLTDLEAKVKLFPNPTTSVITADVTLAEQTTSLIYSITDMQGRQIFSVEKNNIKQDVSEFNVESLPVGIYNLNITTDKGIKTERFNVQR